MAKSSHRVLHLGLLALNCSGLEGGEGAVGREPNQDDSRSRAGAGVVTIFGRNRLPGDVSSELMAVLATEPPILVCDLAGTASPVSLSHIFEPVADYLRHWAGTIVVAVAPDTEVRSRLSPVEVAGRLLVHAEADSGIAVARDLVAEVDRKELHLMPGLTAPREARKFATRTLLDWQAPRLIRTTNLVVSELVTESVLAAQTVVDLALSRSEARVRVAVHDRGGGRPRPRHNGWQDETLTGRGMLLVEKLTDCWGLFPERVAGKTVWAVLDAA